MGIWAMEVSALSAGKFLVLVVLAVGACIWDLRTRRVPNVLTASSAAAGLVLSLFEGGWLGGGWALAGLAAGGGIFVPLVLWRVVGAGDMKLMAAAGVLLGPLGILRSILVGVILGGFWGLAWLSVKKDRKSFFPYAPPLAAGIVIAFLFLER